MMWADRTTPRRLAHLSIVTAVALAALAGAMTEVSAASADPVDQPSCTQVTCVFLLAKGRLTAFDAPGPAAQDLVRINNRGQIVGGTKERCCRRGLPRLPARQARPVHHDRLSRRGRDTAIRHQRPRPDRGHLQRHRIRTRGARLTSAASCCNERGEFTTIDVPGAVQTLAFGINNRGQVVGEYLDADGMFHGYPVGQGAVHDVRRARWHRGIRHRHQRSRPDRWHLFRR